MFTCAERDTKYFCSFFGRMIPSDVVYHPTYTPGQASPSLKAAQSAALAWQAALLGLHAIGLDFTVTWLLFSCRLLKLTKADFTDFCSLYSWLPTALLVFATLWTQAQLIDNMFTSFGL